MGIVRRAGRHIAWRARRSAMLIADRLRCGDRTVIMTPPAGLRFGNWLYVWLEAHRRTAGGHPTVILEAPGMEPWLNAIPPLRALTVTRGALRFRDRREREWTDRSWNQRFGEEFSREELDTFIREILAPVLTADESSTIVINVRRGDYYSDPGLQERYGFDQLGYLREALSRIGDIGRVVVVSDDAAWCRRHLEPLLRVAERVDYAPMDPVASFTRVAGTRRLIGMNSTFTYWGGYIAGAIHEGEVQIVMPRFHARLPGGSDAYQLDPRWIIIDGYDDSIGTS